MTGSVNVLVGTPCTQSGVTRQYLSSVLALQRHCDDLGWGLRVETRVDGLVTRTRNIFASHLVHSEEFTHLLMVDADIGFDPSVITRLVGSGHDLVGACVPLREVRWGRVREALDRVPDLGADELSSMAHGHAVSFEPPPPGGTRRAVQGFLPARFLGGALLLARREVFTRLSDSAFVDHYDHGGPWSDWPEDGWTFFDPMIDPEIGTYLSEDYALCHRWRQAGGTVWADVLARVTHTGAVTVTGDMALTQRTAARIVRSSPAPSPPGHDADD